MSFTSVGGREFTGRRVRAQRPSPWLIGSLLVNLALIGLIAAWVMAMRSHHSIVGWQRDVLGEVSDSDAAAIARGTDLLEAAQAKSDRSLAEQYAKLKTILATEPFDKTACEEVLNEMNAARDEAQIDIGQAFVAEVATISPEARRKLVAAMDREARRWHPPWH